MTVTLKIEVTSPLTDDDRDLLAGLAVMTVAIANRQINQEAFEEAGPPPVPELTPACGDMETVGDRNDAERQTYTGRVCVSDPGHAGRHRYRDPQPVPVLGMN